MTVKIETDSQPVFQSDNKYSQIRQDCEHCKICEDCEDCRLYKQFEDCEGVYCLLSILRTVTSFRTVKTVRIVGKGSTAL